MRALLSSLLVSVVLAASATAAPAQRTHKRPHRARHHASRHQPIVERPDEAAAVTEARAAIPPANRVVSGAVQAAAPPTSAVAVAGSQSVVAPSLQLAALPTAAAVAPEPAVLEPPKAAVVTPALTLNPPAKAAGREHRWDLFGGGVALFLGGYALDIGLSYGLSRDTSTSLIPLAGPLLQLRDRWGTIGATSSGNATIDQASNAGISVVNQVIQDAAYVILSVDFVLQLAGAAMTVVGAVGHQPRHYAEARRDVAWRIAPGGLRVTF